VIMYPSVERISRDERYRRKCHHSLPTTLRCCLYVDFEEEMY
jgi:hypothetical protein